MGVLEEQQVADQRWRQEVSKRLDEHMERLDQGEARMTALEHSIKTNTDITTRVEANTQTLVLWVTNATGFKNTVKWFGGLILWLSVVMAGMGVLWWVAKTGELPHKVEAPAIERHG